jgi:hypothetical protein
VRQTLIAAGIPVNIAPPKIALGEEERVKLVEDLDAKFFSGNGAMSRVPNAAKAAAALAVGRKQSSQLLTGSVYLEQAAAKLLQKQAEAVAAEERRAAKRVRVAAKKAEREATKARVAAKKAEREARSAAKAQLESVVGGAQALAHAAVRKVGKGGLKRLRGGESAVDGAYRPAKKSR